MRPLEREGVRDAEHSELDPHDLGVFPLLVELHEILAEELAGRSNKHHEAVRAREPLVVCVLRQCLAELPAGGLHYAVCRRRGRELRLRRRGC